MKSNGSRRPDEIAREIDRTRNNMGATLDAIRRRFTPGELVDQGLDYVRNSGANEFVSNLGTSVKNNPLPLVLVGVGIAWLMAADKRPPSERAAYGGWPEGEGFDEVSSAAGGLRERVGEKAGEAREKIGYAMESAREGLASARERGAEYGQAASERLSAVRGRGEEIRHSARERLAAMRDRGSEMGYAARASLASARERGARLSQSALHQLDNARAGAGRLARERPLMMGAAALAVGGLIAALAPRTRKEDEMMGEASDRFAEKAREAGKEQLEKAQQVAVAAKDAATEEAKREFAQPENA